MSLFHETVARLNTASLSGVDAAVRTAYSRFGELTDEQTTQIAELAQSRRDKLQGRRTELAPRRSGSRPRSIMSIERRRRWACAGYVPPHIAAGFTLAESAVLAVVALEVSKKGSCALSVGHLAALAGVGLTTARNAIRRAARLGFLTVEHRRVSAWRNETNLVRVTCSMWRGWIRFRCRGGGFKSVNPTKTKSILSPFLSGSPRSAETNSPEYRPPAAADPHLSTPYGGIVQE